MPQIGMHIFIYKESMQVPFPTSLLLFTQLYIHEPFKCMYMRAHTFSTGGGGFVGGAGGDARFFFYLSTS